jgi:2-polyprenyl-6-methoxyphenol hydroxylase-like FAD-dependent oxidoreductase
VLEKHPDFFRDFRGDTVHPSTLEVMCELGLIDEFLKLPHQKVETLTGQVTRSSNTFPSSKESANFRFRSRFHEKLERGGR